MRTAPRIWEVWGQGGPFIGEDRPVGRATVERDYYLQTRHGVADPNKSPVRWFQRQANDQAETELPNIRSITINRSLDADAGTCDITISNQWMKANTEGQIDPRVLGAPGYFSFDHGGSAEAQGRWRHSPNSWFNVITPNALIRTYQGYGGAGGPIADAVGTGRLVLTGLWLVDTVRISSSGEIQLRCRDMAKLLIEQQLYPPLVPAASYPLRYCRWYYRPECRTVGGGSGSASLSLSSSGNYAWVSSGDIHGHNPGDAFDGNLDTFWLSVGNSRPGAPYAAEWIEANCGQNIDTVHVTPWAGNYSCWVSVMENGAWVDEGPPIEYDEAGVGRYNGAYEVRIPTVMRVGIPWESPTTIPLPRTYAADKVRLTFYDLADSEWGPYTYRAGVREFGASQGGSPQQVTEIVRYDGNYFDFADIVKDLLLWAGWHLYDPGGGYPPGIFGNIESTGSYSEECFPEDAFDKRPVIDAITTVKEVVGYIFWIDEDGAARFESPNWWAPGNFYTDGSHTDFVPEVDERLQLTDYSMQTSDAPARSEIIVAAADPVLFPDNVTHYVPSTSGDLKGMVKPAVFVNGVLVSAAEQRTMAELIAMHMYFQQRQGNVTAAANPAIQINDQVRIVERITGDTYVHYVRGVQTTYEAEAGTYTMVLTTHWLGAPGQWAAGG